MSIDGDQRPLDLDSCVVIPFTTLSETTLSERSNIPKFVNPPLDSYFSLHGRFRILMKECG